MFAASSIMKALRTYAGILQSGLRLWLRGFLTVDWVWFDADFENSPADIIHIRQRPSLPDGISGEIFHTLTIDLKRDEDVLWRALEKPVQYEVRRADREEVRVFCDQHLHPAAMADFRNSYERFRKRKLLGPLNDPHLGMLLAKNRLVVSSSRSQDGATCSWHVYVLGEDRARLLHSVSNVSDQDDAARRAFIARANRLHHWRDILQFRANGYKVYDLGGWYARNDNEAKLRINRFKQGFGGTVEASYNAEIPLSFRGRVALLLWNATFRRHGISAVQ